MSTITAPGIYENISEKEYHADCCAEISLSSTIAKKLVAQSPAHAHLAHPRLGGAKEEGEEESDPKSTKAQEKGTLIHRLLINDGADILECLYDSWRKDAAKAERDLAKAKGLVPTLPHLLADARAAANAARKQLDDLGYGYAYRDGMKEVVIVWEEDGIWLRAKLDNLHIDETHKIAEIRDLKTVTRSSHPEACAAQIDKMGYDLSIVFYKRGLIAVRPDLAGRIKCAWDFVETSAPYAATPVEIAAEWELAAEMKCERAIALWRKCMAEKRWPYYTMKQVRLNPKPWMLGDLMANQHDE